MEPRQAKAVLYGSLLMSLCVMFATITFSGNYYLSGDGFNGEEGTLVFLFLSSLIYTCYALLRLLKCRTVSLAVDALMFLLIAALILLALNLSPYEQFEFVPSFIIAFLVLGVFLNVYHVHFRKFSADGTNE